MSNIITPLLKSSIEPPEAPIPTPMKKPIAKTIPTGSNANHLQPFLHAKIVKIISASKNINLNLDVNNKTNL